MSEKEKVLQQISEIKNHLVDKEVFFPYNFNACHVWSAIAVVLTFVMVPSYETSVMFGTVVTTVMMALGFLIEAFLMKKVNQSYDLDDCTRRQEFIVKNFLMIALFLIVFSAMLAIYKLYVPILLLWIALISIGFLAIGFVLNLKAYGRLAMFNMTLALLLLIIGMSFNLLEDMGSFLTIVQISLVFGLAIFPSILALKQAKQAKESCGV